MTQTDPPKQSMAWRVARYAVSAILCLLLVAAAYGVLAWINSTEPTAQREGATRKTAALVDTIEMTRGTYSPEINVLGRVTPVQLIELGALVSGEVIEIDPSYDVGKVVEKGQLLMKINPADYENQLRMRESDLKEVEAQLVLEKGRQAVARKELETLGRDLEPENRALVLRQPQIDTLRAQIAARQAEIDQAKLDLKRTEVRAPFFAQILSRRVNLGMQVGTGDTITRLVDVSRYRVRASVPQSHIERLIFADENGTGSVATLRQPSVWGEGVSREGEVTRLVGELDPDSRLAQVLITIDDPLTLETDGPRLLLDAIVQVTLQCEPIRDVVRLPREYLRQNDTVWVYDDAKLAIREVRIAFGNSDYVYITEGLNEGDRVVTTSLASVVEGRALRRSQDASTDADAAAGSPDAQPTGGSE